MSCKNAPTSSRSGRLTERASPAAWAAHSSRCRSTVNRCTGLRCALIRTLSHSGISRTMSPARSSASNTGTARSPVPSRATSSLRASSGHGSGSGAHSVTRRSIANGANGRPCSAAARAARRTSTGSAHGSAARASTTSPPWLTTPRASGWRSGPIGTPPEPAGFAGRDVDPAPRVVAQVGQRPSGFVHRPQQRVVVDHARGRRRRRPAPGRAGCPPRVRSPGAVPPGRPAAPTRRRPRAGAGR